MRDCFQLIDLVSQARAVRKLLTGKTDSEKLAWLSAHGKVDVVATKHPNEKQCYHFTSALGREAIFFFDAADLVFIGDHTTFTVDEE
jgi:hypothetical protein